MFRYFRKIREALLNEGRFQKYLIYAIGEILLVVIGILIALQINTWNNERLDRIEEQLLLDSILSKMEYYQIQQEFAVQRYNEVIEAATKLLQFTFLVTDTETEEIERNLHLLTNRFLVGKANRVSIYDEMIGSGQLMLISSDDLREDITILKENLLLLESYEEIQIDFVESQLIPYLNQNTNAISIYANGSISDTTGYDNSISIDYSSFYVYQENRSYTNILNDQEFANLLFDLIQHTKPLFPIYKRLGGDIESITRLASQLKNEN